MKKTIESINKVFSDPIAQYVIIITSFICATVIAQITYNRILHPYFPNLPEFIEKKNGIDFIKNFIEWFGVLYGFLLPLILVKVWEGFDEIDSVFDREADTIKILFEDILLLSSDYKPFKLKVVELLKEYVDYVIANCHVEGSDRKKREAGNKILQTIRESYIKLIYKPKKDGEHETNSELIAELLHSLNNVIDLRGDRISLSTKRLFESLKFIAVATSIVWLVPFYIMIETNLGIFGSILIICVIFLVIIILAIIADLDEPFSGYWKIDQDSWLMLRDELEKYIMGTIHDT